MEFQKTNPGGIPEGTLAGILNRISGGISQRAPRASSIKKKFQNKLFKKSSRNCLRKKTLGVMSWRNSHIVELKKNPLEISEEFYLEEFQVSFRDFFFSEIPYGIFPEF